MGRILYFPVNTLARVAFAPQGRTLDRRPRCCDKSRRNLAGQ